MTNPTPYTVYRLDDGRHVRTMSPARLVEGERDDRRVRVYPVDDGPTIDGETLVPADQLDEVAPRRRRPPNRNRADDDQRQPPSDG